MALPNFDEVKELLARSKRDDQSWGNLFREISSGTLHNESLSPATASIFSTKPSLIHVLAEWDFYSSKFLDEAASDYGVKSWQVTEYVEGLREALSISEQDLIIYEKKAAEPAKIYSAERTNLPDHLTTEPQTQPHNALHPDGRTLSQDQNNQGIILILITLSFLMAGGLLMLITFLTTQKSSNQEPSLSSQIQSLEPEKILPNQNLARSTATTASRSNQWQACQEEEQRIARPPQPGEIWWPVVGPHESLSSARRFCRPDAFKNKSGNVQIASFRDKETAESFARQLTSDVSHPYEFWVGEPSQR